MICTGLESLFAVAAMIAGGDGTGACKDQPRAAAGGSMHGSDAEQCLHGAQAGEPAADGNMPSVAEVLGKHKPGTAAENATARCLTTECSSVN